MVQAAQIANEKGGSRRRQHLCRIQNHGETEAEAFNTTEASGHGGYYLPKP